ncbi:MAG TPA: lipid-A-disaccharide synthase, partial [Acetobacteraceae bacterium]|nr:lipid-A-disaccharide synthase [Acetobacteraceae bacterium]
MALIYLLAGEASGDALGGRLMAAMRRARPDLDFAGIGGARMAEQGLASLFPMQDLAVMGFAEILPRLPLLRARLDQAVADVAAHRPDVVVTIDAPGFALRLLRRIAPLGIRR